MCAGLADAAACAGGGNDAARWAADPGSAERNAPRSAALRSAQRESVLAPSGERLRTPEKSAAAAVAKETGSCERVSVARGLPTGSRGIGARV
mmetsp:Transcript_54632/g.119184  ORF Transcript_54632/g.119184 Transcript_54632/m.119184 type:complete len:93 (+) Transcript_54632:660-938(+)